jgi:hypothetical protein
MAEAEDMKRRHDDYEPRLVAIVLIASILYTVLGFAVIYFGCGGGG